MIISYIKTILRFFSKNKANYLINLLGLSIGLTIFLIIGLYVSFEFSYDRFHKNHANTYRMICNLYDEGNRVLLMQFSRTPVPMAPAVEQEIPEIRNFVRTAPIGGDVAIYKDRKFYIDNVTIADTSFFNVFSFGLKKGNPAEVLKNPFSAVVTEKMANRLFGDADPIGKAFSYGGKMYMVTGVAQPLPAYSSIYFDFVVSDPARIQNSMNDWYNDYSFTSYLVLHDGADGKVVEDKINSYLKKRFGPDVRATFSLQPMKDIHLRSSHLKWEGGGDLRSLYFLIVLGLFILITAWVNYINLSLTKSMEKGRELGLRKIFGASRTDLVTQFMLEAALFNVASCVLAVIVALLLLSRLNAAFNLNLTFWNVFSSQLWFTLLLFLVGGMLICSLYPALLFSAIKPIEIFKKKISRSTSKVSMKQVFLVVQFAVCTFLLLGAATVFLQLRYLMNKEPGIELDHILLVTNPTRQSTDDAVIQRGQSFMKEVAGYAGVNGVTLSNYPGEGYFSEFELALQQRKNDIRLVKFAYIDDKFVDVYKLKIIAGQNIVNRTSIGGTAIAPVAGDSVRTENGVVEDDAVLLNEEAVKLFGFAKPENAIGNFLVGYRNKNLRIAGVLKNYHQESAKMKVSPVVFKMHPYSPHKYFSVRVSGKDPRSVVPLIRQKYESLFPEHPYGDMLLKDLYNQQYATEKHFQLIFGSLTIVAITLASLGLLSVLSNSIRKRLKEFAVHKVFGANGKQLSWLILKDLVRAIVVGVVIAEIIGFVTMRGWLKNYESRISLGIWFYITPFIVIFSVLAAVTGRVVLKATSKNPTSLLRDE
ncbi:ABC transporter permease [Chitinophaga qingshengii]|uniref:ABC transporter permease n=1 Tax=Chitinophaga qingshengii TaxID=1569794 RepID=A0ABR7TIH8_9BACT|nr:ABC transporter permease [Chitinophaga qingshengii]MBC9929277.1 ABC transporter permease [Chitinophaga qingshengii]